VPNFVKLVPPGDERERDTCATCGWIDYRNPKVVVGCLPLWVRPPRPSRVTPRTASSARVRSRDRASDSRPEDAVRLIAPHSFLPPSPPPSLAQVDASGTTRVLMCRRGIEPRVGKWGFPQGFMELGESTRGGAARETMEESGAAVVPGALLAVYNLPGQVQILYLAEVKGTSRGGGEPPEVECGPESLEAAYFALDDPPEEDELAFPTVKWALEYAAAVAVPAAENGEPIVPQQRTKLVFAEEVAFEDETGL
jgi:ADP-ribose pyrophosphatase YjhB (NUDIX family)